MQLLLPGEDIKFSDPADVGGSYEAFQYRTLLACCSAMGVPYTNVTGDLRQANYSSLREGKLEFRRRIEQFQHGTLVFQLCRRVWQRWIRDAVLAGALELPGFAQDPAPYLAVKWIPPKWDWVDPLKDRKAEIEAIEAGLKSRSDVIESEGYDAEEVDRRIAADHAREEELASSSAGPQPLGRSRQSRSTRGTRAPDAERGGSGLKRWYDFRAQAGRRDRHLRRDRCLRHSGQGVPRRAESARTGRRADSPDQQPGGSVFDGVAIYNALKRHDAAITVWIDGIAASIASMIAMAGDKVVMPENAMLVCTTPRGSSRAPPRTCARWPRRSIDEGWHGRRLPRQVGPGRCRNRGADAAETWLSAQEAVALGLADRVEEPVRMAAHFDLSRFRHSAAARGDRRQRGPQEDDMRIPERQRTRRAAPDRPTRRRALTPRLTTRPCGRRPRRRSRAPSAPMRCTAADRIQRRPGLQPPLRSQPPR